MLVEDSEGVMVFDLIVSVPVEDAVRSRSELMGSASLAVEKIK